MRKSQRPCAERKKSLLRDHIFVVLFYVTFSSKQICRVGKQISSCQRLGSVDYRAERWKVFEAWNFLLAWLQQWFYLDLCMCYKSQHSMFPKSSFHRILKSPKISTHTYTQIIFFSTIHVKKSRLDLLFSKRLFDGDSATSALVFCEPIFVFVFYSQRETICLKQ